MRMRISLIIYITVYSTLKLKLGFTLRHQIKIYNLRKIIFKKFLQTRTIAENYRENLKDGLLNDRYEILKRVHEKFPEVELNVSANYFDSIVEKYVRKSDQDTDPNKIDDDEGHGQDNKISGDFSYNIAVSFNF